jgi:CRISPR-associated protein Cmx8
METEVMAKKPTPLANAVKPDKVTVTYDLFDLPSAQHKAGLAGLLLQIDWMLQRKPKLPAPCVLRRDATSATIEYTEETVQSLMDTAYDAEWTRVTVKSKWPNTVPLSENVVEETDEHGKPKRVKVFVYEVCRPKGHFLRRCLGEQKEIWHKLWRDMLWAIPRAQPLTRKPFEQRADGQPCKEGAAAWADLLKVVAARDKGSFYTTAVAGSLCLGAQATNAEGVPFEGRAEQNLLLHFWPLTSLVFSPRVVQSDGSADVVGYVLAIPEVIRLDAFLRQYPRMLEGLDSKTLGYRPAEAIIDLPAEGALSFLEHLARLADDRTANSDLKRVIGSVEYLHLAKFGNNVKTMAAGRLAPRRGLLEDYQAVAGRPGERPPYGNPLFRRALMVALLEEKPWFVPFGNMLCEWPHRFFVPTDNPPKSSWFWADARKKFSEEMKDMQTDPKDMPPESNGKLASLVFRLVRSYVSVKAKDKSGVDPDTFKAGETIDWDKVPAAYKEARRQIAETLFLEYRSRREQAFVDHFVARLGAVKQFIKEDDYLAVSHALMEHCEDVKTLTLLALSANS